MDVILIPGFWLGADSWGPVIPALESAGHRVHALTLPGLETQDADRAGITLDDHIGAVVAALEAIPDPSGPVALVGHSGGGPIAYAAAALVPGPVDRFVFVDTFPLPTGGVINDELASEHGEVPLPARDTWPDNEVAGLDDAAWARFADLAVPEPEQVAAGEFALASTAARAIPATVIATSYPESEIRKYLDGGAPWLAELAAMRSVTYVDLDTGHWPQFSRPDELAAIIVAALE